MQELINRLTQLVIDGVDHKMQADYQHLAAKKMQAEKRRGWKDLEHESDIALQRYFQARKTFIAILQTAALFDPKYDNLFPSEVWRQATAGVRISDKGYEMMKMATPWKC